MATSTAPDLPCGKCRRLAVAGAHPLPTIIRQRRGARALRICCSSHLHPEIQIILLRIAVAAGPYGHRERRHQRAGAGRWQTEPLQSPQTTAAHDSNPPAFPAPVHFVSPRKENLIPRSDQPGIPAQPQPGPTPSSTRRQPAPVAQAPRPRSPRRCAAPRARDPWPRSPFLPRSRGPRQRWWARRGGGGPRCGCAVALPPRHWAVGAAAEEEWSSATGTARTAQVTC